MPERLPLGALINIADGYDAFVRLLRSRLHKADGFEQAYAIGVDCPDLPALDASAKDVCRRYLHAGDAERVEIRAAFRDPDARSFLPWFALRISEKFKEPGAADWLLVSLAAPSIHDERDSLDVRDDAATLYTVYRRAENAGIDAKPFLREVAALSNEHPPYPDKVSVAARMRTPFPDLRKAPFLIEEEIQKSRQEHEAGAPVYFYQGKDGHPIGPLTARSLRECRYRGLVNGRTMLRKRTAEVGEWRAASEFSDVFPRVQT